MFTPSFVTHLVLLSVGMLKYRGLMLVIFQSMLPPFLIFFKFGVAEIYQQHTAYRVDNAKLNS